MRKRSEEQERELSSIRGERDNLRDRQNRAQVQVEELARELDRLHNMLSNQVEGGEQIGNLTRDMAALRENLADANAEIVERLHDELTKDPAIWQAVIKQRDQLAEERAAARRRFSLPSSKPSIRLSRNCAPKPKKKNKKSSTSTTQRRKKSPS